MLRLVVCGPLHGSVWVAQRRFATERIRASLVSRSVRGLTARGPTIAISLLPLSQRRFQSQQSDDVPNAMPMHEDLYARLGLTRGSDRNEIKSNYRKLAKRYHPDHNVGNKDAEEAFKRINEAYEILSDADKRRLYDATGRTQSGPGGMPGAEWTSTYYYRAQTYNPYRFYLGVLASTWIVVMMIKWFASGTFVMNFWNFFVILATVTFLGRIPAACILFYLYSPSGTSKGVVSDGSTILLHTQSPPDPRLKPTRTVRLTAVNRNVVLAGGYVKFTCRFEGSLDPVVVMSKPGETWALLPSTVSDVGLHITADLFDPGHHIIKTTVVDLAA